jgi:hypothetical protein
MRSNAAATAPERPPLPREPPDAREEQLQQDPSGDLIAVSRTGGEAEQDRVRGCRARPGHPLAHPFEVARAGQIEDLGQASGRSAVRPDRAPFALELFEQ